MIGIFYSKASNSAREETFVCSVVVSSEKGSSLLEPIGGDAAKTCKRGDERSCI